MLRTIAYHLAFLYVLVALRLRDSCSHSVPPAPQLRPSVASARPAIQATGATSKLPLRPTRPCGTAPFPSPPQLTPARALRLRRCPFNCCGMRLPPPRAPARRSRAPAKEPAPAAAAAPLLQHRRTTPLGSFKQGEHSRCRTP